MARASTIDERLAKGFLPGDTQNNEVAVKARFDAWCRAVAEGDWHQFRQRLAWDELDEDIVRRILGDVRAPKNMPLPRWADTLNEVVTQFARLAIDEAGESQADDRLPLLNTKDPFPFEELLAPFTLMARRRCIDQAGDAYYLLCEEAHTSLQRSLLRTLTDCAAQALYLEFSIARALAQSPLERLLKLAQKDTSRAHYQKFIERMKQGQLKAFFQEYTVLARLLATITDLWVEATVEFLHRLADDMFDVQQIFGGTTELGPVISVQPSLSDAHCNRRQVIALTFASGCKVVYKPRNLGIEEAYYRLLAWCNRRGINLPLRVLKVLNRSSHGWVEFVERQPCKDHEEAQRYYQRAGMLLCLIYALEGTDCHFENLIASGEQPVLVDLETLLHHRPCLEDQNDGGGAQVLADQQMAHSVLRTGLLPDWQTYNDTRIAYDISGLGGGSGRQELAGFGPRCEHINTDQMTLEYGPKTGAQTCYPVLDDMSLTLEEHTAEVVTGFRWMYQFLVNQRNALLAVGSPLRELAHQQVRFVYRSTQVYFSIFQKLLHPMYLSNGCDLSVQLELLGRAVVPFEDPLRRKGKRPLWWPVFAAERKSIEQADIPLFTAQTSSRNLIVIPGQEIFSCFQQPSFELVVSRLQALGDKDLERQVGLIRSSMYAYVARGAARVTGEHSQESSVGRRPAGVSPTEELLKQALAIAQQISAGAIRAADGSASWIALNYLLRAERFQLRSMSYDLFGGTCGVAMFLAAVEKFASGAGYGELALGALQPVRSALRNYENSMAGGTGIGGALGLGSVVYALTQVSQWLDEPALLEDAQRAARLITAGRIANDNVLDIMGGAAGAILGLLALYAVSPDKAVLDHAKICGQHLLQRRTGGEAGYRTWRTPDGKMLTGFSHGAAGIAYALLRLYAVTGDKAVLAAAQEGIAYEDSRFVEEAGNWWGSQIDEQPAFGTSWCHGAPGILLGRIGGLAVLDNDDIRRDIEVAIHTTQALAVQGVDHLCCGSLGRADVLLVAANRLSRLDLAEVANTWALQIVARTQDSGTFALPLRLPKDLYTPGLFQGTAGIGYELLRITNPEMLPSVLLWE